MNAAESIQQHVIDPEICIRCNTCEDTCPVNAVTHDDTNYVVNPELCGQCMDCISPCPTGAIDNWRTVLRASAYTLDDQFSWEALPDEIEPGGDEKESLTPDVHQKPGTAPEALPTVRNDGIRRDANESSTRLNSTLPPWSAAHPYTNLYGPKSAQGPIRATVTGNFRVTEVGTQYDTHHIVLDFGTQSFPVLEGQSIGIVPPGRDSAGRAHHARQYSIANARNGERPGYNNISLTIKRVLEDHDGHPVHGVASNYMCDLNVGDTVDVVGPFGTTFLMPNHPHSNIVMICTGTGSAPMRAMTEWRRRLAKRGKFQGGSLWLFFGARTPEELPYFGPLRNLPADFINIHFAFSRVPDQPKRYVQDVMREEGEALSKMLTDPNTYFYVCGLKAMEPGVLQAMRDICSEAGGDWATVSEQLRAECRLHLETY